jgi:hypothetical protein
VGEGLNKCKRVRVGVSYLIPGLEGGLATLRCILGWAPCG